MYVSISTSNTSTYITHKQKHVKMHTNHVYYLEIHESDFKMP